MRLGIVYCGLIFVGNSAIYVVGTHLRTMLLPISDEPGLSLLFLLISSVERGQLGEQYTVGQVDSEFEENYLKSSVGHMFILRLNRLHCS